MADDPELVQQRRKLRGRTAHVLEVRARLRVEIQAQLVAVLGVRDAVGPDMKAQAPRLTAQATCARSAITSARDRVPLTVITVDVSSQSGAFRGTRF
jgi:hypothetical protein